MKRKNSDGLDSAETHDRRLNRRYPITLELHYKLLTKGQVDQIGTGRTINISSSGVLLEADTILPATGPIELGISWPFLLEGTLQTETRDAGADRPLRQP